jgi:hypothetical protein
MSKVYWNLFHFEDGKKWVMAFGDYNRSVVVQEKRDEFTGERTRIIPSNDTQEGMKSILKSLNE